MGSAANSQAAARLMQAQKPDPIGIRFKSAEARLDDLEDTLTVMRDLLNKNNESLAEILRAVAGKTQ